VRHVEHRRVDAHEQQYAVQLHEAEHVERRRDRYRPQQHEPPEVGADQQRPAAQPIRQGADRKAEQQDPGSLAHGQQRDLEGRGAEHGQRQQRYGEQADPAAELAERVRCPQVPEVVLPQQPATPSQHAPDCLTIVESSRLNIRAHHSQR
jgi:hypothetical protein